MTRDGALLAVTLMLCVWVASAQRAGPPTEMLIRQGLMALQARNIPEAQDFLERAIEQSPDEARAWIGLAQIYRMLNLHTQASRHASEAARLGEDSPIIQHALALFYGDYGNWGEAARWEEAFARSGKANGDAYARAVSLYLQADMPLRAIEVGREGLLHYDVAPLHNVLGKAYAMAEQPLEGLLHLTRAVHAQPYEESFHVDLGFFHFKQEDFAAASDAFLSGRQYFDKSPAIELGLGIAAYGKSRFTEAIDHLLRASELAPPMEQPHALLGRLLQHAKDRLGAVEERMRIFHEQHSKTYIGPFLYGQVLLARLGARRDLEAMATIESLLRESIRRRGDFWQSHYELGVLLEKKRDFRAAEEEFRRAVALNPDASKPHYRLARVYQRLGKSKEAKRERSLHQKTTERERRARQSGTLPGELLQPLGATPP